VRGKIHQYAAVGLPCVASSLAAVGLKYKSGDSILIADNPHDFAKYCISLLNDKDLRTKIGQAAKRICFENYTWHSMTDVISNVYELDS